MFLGMETKLTPEARRVVAKALRAGLPLGRTADAAGVARSTLWRWIRRDPTLGAARDRRAAALAELGGQR